MGVVEDSRVGHLKLLVARSNSRSKAIHRRM